MEAHGVGGVDAGRRRRAALAGHQFDAETARTLLADPDSGVRATALAALARMGQLEDDELRSGLADRDAVVRRRACELTAAGGAVSPVDALGDADATVVEAAAWAAGERGDPAAVVALAHVAGDHDDPLCREAAVAALGAIGDAAGLPAILAATEDKPAVRRRAVIALAPFDGPEVDAALQRALADRDRQVRQAAEDQLEL
jgi:HEAT repeat protein